MRGVHDRALQQKRTAVKKRRNSKEPEVDISWRKKV